MKINSVHGLMTSEDSTGLSQIFRCEDFSPYNHMTSVTALVLKLCHLLRCRVNLKVTEIPFKKKLKAEELWISESQKCLTGHNRFKQWKVQFDLFRDEKGIWRGRGRIQNAVVPY